MFLNKGCWFELLRINQRNIKIKKLYLQLFWVSFTYDLCALQSCTYV